MNNMAKVINQNDLIDIIESSTNADIFFSNLKNNIMAIIENFSTIKKSQIIRSTKNIKLVIDSLASIYEYFMNSSFLQSVLLMQKNDLLGKQIKTVNEIIINSIKVIFEVLDKSINIKNFLSIKLKVKLLVNLIKKIVLDISTALTNIGEIKNINTKQLKELSNVIKYIKDILIDLTGIKINSLLVKIVKQKFFEIIFNSLKNVINIISSIDKRKITSAVDKTKAIKSIISSLLTIITSLLLMLPVMLLFIVASPLIMLCFWTITKIFEFLAKLLKPKQLLNMTLGLIVIGVIVTSILVLVAMFFAIAILSEQINPRWGDIIICLLGIMAVTTLMGLIAIGIGLLVVKLAMATAGLGPAVILVGLATMALIVSAFLIIAVELRILQEINLDSKKIINNTKIVIKTAFEVIKAVFESTYEIGGAQKSDSWFSKILGFMGGAVASMMTAILSVRFLALTVVSVGLILIIAIELRILQTLTLNKEKILENVNTIITTALEVIKSIFENTYEIGGAQKSDSWFSKVLGFIGGAVATMLTAILSIRFLALTIVSIGLILIIAIELRILQTLDLKKDKILENVNIVITTALEVIKAIFEPKGEDNESPTNKNWFVKVLEYIGGTIINIISAILSIRFLAMTIISIALICLIAKQLTYIQSLTLDKENIKEKISTVLAAANMVIGAIFDTQDSTEESPSNKGWLRSALEFLGAGPMLKLVDAITSIAYLGMVFFSIYIIKEIAQNLSLIEKIELNKTNIINKVNNILSVAKNVHDEIIKYDFGEFDFSALRTNKRKIKKLNRFIDNITSSVQEIIQNINSIESIKNVQHINKTIDSLDDILNNIMSKFNVNGLNFDKKVQNLYKLKDIIENISSINVGNAGLSKEVLDNYSGFITKIENTSLNKLETTANLFEKMAKFSESINGNFEELAEVLNEKIAPLLEELKEMMDGVGKKVEKSGADMSASVYAAANPSINQAAQTAQVSREMPGESPEKQAQIAQQRMEEQMRKQSSDVSSKLDELIELFKNGIAQVRMA